MYDPVVDGWFVYNWPSPDQTCHSEGPCVQGNEQHDKVCKDLRTGSQQSLQNRSGHKSPVLPKLKGDMNRFSACRPRYWRCTVVPEPESKARLFGMLKLGQLSQLRFVPFWNTMELQDSCFRACKIETNWNSTDFIEDHRSTAILLLAGHTKTVRTIPHSDGIFWASCIFNISVPNQKRNETWALMVVGFLSQTPGLCHCHKEFSSTGQTSGFPDDCQVQP